MPHPASPRPSAACAIPIVLALMMVLAATSTATAAPITYAYSGTITASSPVQTVRPGDRFSGTISFDPEGPFTRTDGGYSLPSSVINDTRYWFGAGAAIPDPARVGMTLEVGGKSLLASSGLLDVRIIRSRFETSDGPRSNSYYYFSHDFEQGVGPDRMSYRLMLHNGTFTAPGTPYAPPTALDLNDFPTATMVGLNLVDDIMDINATRPPDRSFFGTLDTFEIVPTPEPSTFVLLGLGVAGWAIRRWRRAVGSVPSERLEDVA